MWGLIEDELVKGNKELAQHYHAKLREIIESPELPGKAERFQKQHWEYQGMPSLLYVEKTITVTPRELMKDLVSWADCLQTIVDRIEQAEAHQAFRATFETDEDYEDYLIDQQNEEFLEQISHTKDTWSGDMANLIINTPKKHKNQNKTPHPLLYFLLSFLASTFSQKVETKTGIKKLNPPHLKYL